MPSYSRLALVGLCLVGASACYERAPRSGPVAAVADSLLPRAAVVTCRELGPSEAVCFGEDGTEPEGRLWQQPAYYAYVTVAPDTSEVELVYTLGRPRVRSSCRIRNSHRVS